MVIRLLLLLSFSLFFTFNVSAQKTKKIGYRKQCKIDSKRQINELKNGVLLVRLKTKQKTIEAMKSRGKLELAEKTAVKLEKRNLIITKAFNDNFTFCPVYFFYSTDSKHIRNNNLDSVNFLNEELVIDPSITVINPIYYVAEFGNIEPSETITYQSTAYVRSKDTRNNYNGSTNFSFKVLVIKDKMFNQLREPFPYYVKESTGVDEEKHLNSAVVKFNFKIIKFHKKIKAKNE